MLDFYDKFALSQSDAMISVVITIACNLLLISIFMKQGPVAKYITHCGYSIENNIASDIRLSRNCNVVNKESKSSRRFVRICNTSSGDNNYCKQGSFILLLGKPPNDVGL